MLEIAKFVTFGVNLSQLETNLPPLPATWMAWATVCLQSVATSVKRWRRRGATLVESLLEYIHIS